jgi:hypothetical protein
MSRQGFDPKTGETFRRLKMCHPCMHGFHLSCTDNNCTCRPNHSYQQWGSMPQAAQEVPRQVQLAGRAIAH